MPHKINIPTAEAPDLIPAQTLTLLIVTGRSVDRLFRKDGYMDSRVFLLLFISLTLLVITTSPPIFGPLIRKPPTATPLPSPTNTPTLTPTATPDPFEKIPTATSSIGHSLTVPSLPPLPFYEGPPTAMPTGVSP